MLYDSVLGAWLIEYFKKKRRLQSNFFASFKLSSIMLNIKWTSIRDNKSICKVWAHLLLLLKKVTRNIIGLTSVVTYVCTKLNTDFQMLIFDCALDSRSTIFLPFWESGALLRVKMVLDIITLLIHGRASAPPRRTSSTRSSLPSSICSRSSLFFFRQEVIRLMIFRK